jgi:hypothetical protein
MQDVADAFTKLREQIMLCFSSSAAYVCGGINIINSTNLDYFSHEQKGELYRLKAMCHRRLGRFIITFDRAIMAHALVRFFSLRCSLFTRISTIISFRSIN